MRPWQLAIKRLIDVGLGAAATLILLPVGIVIALAIAVDSSGGPIYGARRVGRHGREFTMWKFRTMARGADRAGPGVTGAWDWRVTRVGAVLRRTKLDELPQLFNVLVGDMSLVGPRPESPKYVARWTEAERGVLGVRPGVTGPTQVAYVDEEERLVGDPDEVYERELMHAKLAMDLAYVRNISLRGDLVLVWRTIAGILSSTRRRTNRPRRRYTLAERLGSIRLPALLLDAALAAMAAALAVGLRIDRNNLLAAAAEYWVFVPLAAFVRPAGFAVAGAYLRVWRYPTVSDAALIVSSLTAGSLVMTLAIFVVMQPWSFPGTVGFPRSAIIIELLLSVLMLGGIRLGARIRQEGVEAADAALVNGPPRPVLIYGAGEAGALLAREMRRSRLLRLEPVAFLDDDPTNHGKRIYGVEVLGGLSDLPAVTLEREVSEVIVALPRISGARLRRVVTLSEAAGIPIRTLPGVDELLDETVTVNKVRPVRVEDLLRREANDIPEEPMAQLVRGRRVVVTGAGGSIGSELCRQVAALGAARVILFERAETPLFYIDEELRRRFPAVEVAAVLGDVTDERTVLRAFERERPDVVLHAAAHKHVPLSEGNVAAAVLANVGGTRIVAEAAARTGCGSFIFISTDKAVDPSSIMGATKRLAELVVQEVGCAASGRFITVRFGNVLGSQGSVLELFRQQIADGGPVTVTHPDMTRYFMTIPEAVRLILYAGAAGQPGHVHVLNMGRPLRIVDMARDLIRLSIPSGEKDIQIVFTGLRPGEKLEETLFGAGEDAIATESPWLLVARQKQPTDRYGSSASQAAREMEELARQGADEALRRQLVGEGVPSTA